MTVPSTTDADQPTHPQGGGDAQVEFLQAFRSHAAGVAVITAGGERPTGFTATSVASFSLDPPMLSFTMSTTSSPWPTFATAEHAAIHLLAADQEDVARIFAAKGVDRLALAGVTTVDDFGVPIITGVMARIVVAIRERFIVHAHAAVIGQVLTAEVADRHPLIYRDRRFTRLDRTP